jgi:protein-S-isoprenylcysteine O-methyltransferase Ste14
MNPAHVLIPAMWLAWIAYWSVASLGAKQTQRTESARSRLSHHLPLFIGALLMGIPNIAGAALEGAFVAPTPLWQWLATALTAAGLGFSVFARIWLAGNWSATVTVKEGHELIRSGPYALVRHPIYTGMLLALIGSALGVGKWRALIGVTLIAAAFVRKLTIEERFMTEQFGEAYARYRAEVPALVPFVI